MGEVMVQFIVTRIYGERDIIDFTFFHDGFIFPFVFIFLSISGLNYELTKPLFSNTLYWLNFQAIPLKDSLSVSHFFPRYFCTNKFLTIRYGTTSLMWDLGW